MKNDSFGDRMKMYEMAESGRKLMPGIPIMARLDGRCFHTFCQGMERPFYEPLSRLMIECTKYLVAETHALCGYTQSDEITLTWHYINPKTEPIFSGRISKIISTLAAMQSVYFNKYMHNYLDAKYCNKIITFDCRVWNVPNIIEGANAFLWREQDATKNSISMAARSYYSHKQLHKKNGAEMQDMLHKVGVNWNDYPSFFKRGTYLMPKLINVNIDELNIDEAKKKYILESNPSLQYQRRIVSEMDLPPLSQVVNRADFIYSGSEPKLFTQ